jgi:nuclease S1
MDIRLRRLRCILLVAGALCAGNAFAWSAEGHRIVARLAAAGLTPQAQAAVADLLAGEPDPTLAGIADWADRLRDEDPERGKATSRWHFINFPGRCEYDAARDCPGGDCVVAAINRSYLALADRKRPLAERREALKFLVHFVGDAHQPLHASMRDDLGGNRHQVNVGGKGSNMHRLWDGTILARRGLDAAGHAARLQTATPLPHDATLGSDRPALEWALESCRLVEGGDLYPSSRVVDDAFLDRQLPLAEERLRRAGSRLAAMLNHALD